VSDEFVHFRRTEQKRWLRGYFKTAVLSFGGRRRR
jgi:hypothetical protein